MEGGARLGIIVTAEEHQVGGLANWVAAVTQCSDRLYWEAGYYGDDWRLGPLGELGSARELVKEFEVSAEHIAAKAKKLYDLKKARA